MTLFSIHVLIALIININWLPNSSVRGLIFGEIVNLFGSVTTS